MESAETGEKPIDPVDIIAAEINAERDGAAPMDDVDRMDEAKR